MFSVRIMRILNSVRLLYCAFDINGLNLKGGYAQCLRNHGLKAAEKVNNPIRQPATVILPENCPRVRVLNILQILP